MNHRLSFPRRLLVRALDGLTTSVVGHSRLELPREMIQTLGLRRFARFIYQSMSVLGELDRRFGETNTQFVVGLTALWNGCGYCSYGHTLTGALMTFRDEGHLHPLHPAAMAELMAMTNEDALARLTQLLDEPRHERLRALATRTYELKLGSATASTMDDYALVAAISMWNYVVECTIVLGLDVRPEQARVPYHPIGRDHALRQRYERARRAAATAER